MEDEKLSDIDREIEALQALRAKRLAELDDPKRQRVRKLYEELGRILGQLEEAGEDLTDENGSTLYIVGTLFDVSTEGVIEK